MKKIPSLLIMVSLLFLFTSCKEKSRFKVDLTNVRVETPIARFDKALLALDTTQMFRELGRLQYEYPDFFPLFVTKILELSPSDTALVADQIVGFLSNLDFRQVNADVLERFDDISGLENLLSTAYSYMHYYFPDMALPKVYFFVSGFNRAILLHNQVLGVGADLYLGADYPAYEDIAYRYLQANMRSESILPDMLYTLLCKQFPRVDNQSRLLEQILYQGKILFLLSVFLPDTSAEDIMGYTKEQYTWCRKHEAAIWTTLIDQKHLFSTDNRMIRQYIDDAPFTSPISQESPGRLGAWLGWQIVKSYMDKNKELSLRDLMIENKSEEILRKSGYRP